MIYIREAHPSDGWVAPANTRAGIEVKDPKTHSERTDVAKRACSTLKIKIPCLVDDVDDAVNRAYAAWPDRLYIVDTAGKIALAGAQGPRGFAPAVHEAEERLAALPEPATRGRANAGQPQ